MNTCNDVTQTPEACPITKFVIALGKLLLLETKRDWVTMESAAELCGNKKLKLNGGCPATSELDATLRRFFHGKDEFYTEGLCIDGYERPSGWNRPFMIRAYPHSFAKPYLGPLCDLDQTKAPNN